MLTPESPATNTYEVLDRAVHATVAKATAGLAPSVFAQAWMDWAVHMAISPGKQAKLAHQGLKNAQALWTQSFDIWAAEAQPESPRTRRFSAEAWRCYPFGLLAEAHELNRLWWQDAVTDVHGVEKAHENLMAFTADLMVEMASPANFPFTNPEVIEATYQEKGQNLIRGATKLARDFTRQASETDGDTEPFEVGRNLAITPGKVVFRNDLIELIQYSPTTEQVHPEPILIVPAWIMKYYILDLSQKNSMVRHLVSQGFTVFMVSWKNPDAEDRDLSMEDYRKLGVMDAIDAAQAITKSPKLHAMGYCLGGTILSIAAATMARDGDERLASLTFLAAQIDFTEAGPLRLFINESEITLIEDLMATPGYLTSDQMAGAFALLRARDLILDPAVRKYLLGEDPSTFDLMAWNADATRMPYRMHSQYLRNLFLNNDLTEGRYTVGDKAISTTDIRAPIFAVGTESDHVAPWNSVFKFHLFTDSDVTFVLTSGGHNAGIVSEPGHRNRHYRIAHALSDAPYRDPTTWCEEADLRDGSWWEELTKWLAGHSGSLTEPPKLGAASGKYRALCDAPGTYVMLK
ncbi:polyhydroxyalkanoic acid synthase [Rhodobacteraceae bacterium NNCM2]|nr:polyhydroxyalkanoic acid synthase [Coraliihabitans acroporae]